MDSCHKNRNPEKYEFSRFHICIIFSASVIHIFGGHTYNDYYYYVNNLKISINIFVIQIVSEIYSEHKEISRQAMSLN